MNSIGHCGGVRLDQTISMKHLRIILLLIVMIAVVIFSVQNAEMVSVQFIGFSGEISKALLMLICFSVGSIVTLAALSPRVFRKKTTKGPIEVAPVAPVPSEDQEENT